MSESLKIEKSDLIEFDEERNYLCEHEGLTSKVYFGLRTVPERWRKTLWDLYQESLHITDAIQDQCCYTEETFYQALVDEDYNKVLMVTNDQPVALLLGTNNLEKAKVAYINPDFIRSKFPQEVAEGRFWYITCLFVSPHLRSLGLVRQMVLSAIDAIWEKDYVLAMDVTDQRLFIPEILVKLAQETSFPIVKEKLGSQEYFAFRKVSH